MKKGSVYQRKGSSRWYLSIDIGTEPDDTGKPRRVRDTYTFDTREEAEEARVEKLYKLQKGTYSGPSKVRVGEWLDSWLQSKVKIKTTTRAGYERSIRRIKTALGPRKLVDLTPAHIRVFYAELTKSGLSAKTVLNLHGVLFSALQQAVEDDVLTRNPAARGQDLPTVEPKEMEVWTADECRKFLRHASSHRWYPAMALAMSSGLRRSEVLGLRWENLDVDNGIAKIRDTLVPVNGGYEHRPDVTKSKKSRRDIPLDPTTVAVLKAHKKEQAGERLASPVWETDLVFTDEIGRPIRPTSFSRAWKRLAEEAGIRPLTPHTGARHGWATLALESGVPMKVVQQQLGHSTMAITADVYSHVAESLSRDAVEKVASMFD